MRDELVGIEVDLTEYAVHHTGDQFGPVGEVPVESSGPGIESLSQRTHRQRVGPLGVNQGQSSSDDAFRLTSAIAALTPPIEDPADKASQR